MPDSYPFRPVWNRRRGTHRRAILGLVATAPAILASRALRAQPANQCVLTPNTGEGPFYFDPDLLRSDITEGVAGAPLALAVQMVREGDCATLADARFDVWQADALGLYSGYGRQPGTGEPLPSVLDEKFLRGTQVTDSDGRVRFQTVWPSWYGGRTPHIHFKVFVGGNEVVASQLYLPDEFNNEVFTSFDPYKERASRRSTMNENDQFLRNGVEGAFCEVERVSGGYSASATVVIRA